MQAIRGPRDEGKAPAPLLPHLKAYTLSSAPLFGFLGWLLLGPPFPLTLKSNFKAFLPAAWQAGGAVTLQELSTAKRRQLQERFFI